MEPLQIVIESARNLARQMLASLPQLLTGLLLMLATWLVARVLNNVFRRIFGRMRMRRSLVELFLKLLGTLVWLLGTLLAATVIFPSLTLGSVLTALGLGSLAIGFAFKDIFENFLAGVLILLREPFRLGDHIECQELEGYVEEITIRDTYIRQTDGQRVVIPNAMLFTNPVTIRTDLDYRRVTVMCGIAYGEDVDRARDVIRQAVRGVESVYKEKEIQIFANRFGDSGVEFEVTWWTGSKPVEVRRSRDAVIAAVKHELDTAGIEIPFPYRTLVFKQPLAVADARDGDGTS